MGLNPAFARPDWLILQVLPIPPPPVRPSVVREGSLRSEVSLVMNSYSYDGFTCNHIVNRMT